MQSFKCVPRSQRDPANNALLPLEFDVLHKMGKIANDETILITCPGGVFKGEDALFARNGFNCVFVVTGDAVFDFTPPAIGKPSAGFPVNEKDTFWTGLGYPVLYNKVYVERDSAVYGGKGGWLQGAGSMEIKVMPGASLRLTGHTLGRQLVDAATGETAGYGNGTGILENWPGCTLCLEGNIEIDNCDDGIRGTFVTIYIGPGVKVHDNGAGDGQSHNIYIDGADVVAIDGSAVYDAHVGHNNKVLCKLFVSRNESCINTRPKRSESYDDDVNGGMAYLIGGVRSDGPGDSNTSVQSNFNTQRAPFGPHGWFEFGVKRVAPMVYSGNFLAIDNRCLVYTNDLTWGPGDWHTAPQMKNADGSLVWMPVSVMVDGCDGQFAPGNVSYKTKNWNVNKVGITATLSNNRLIAVNDPAASQNATNVDLAKLAASGRIGALLAPFGLIAPYTPELIAALRTEILAERAAWKYPAPMPSAAAPADAG